ncbi:MAG: sigma-54-dependent Fis family transcriptional regulator, partial [Desulfarculus sp.]|nr:sigma-54-dependent Fis family transcriptional regulator [Desulfarculus sp.]
MPASPAPVSILIAEKRATAAQRMQAILAQRGHQVSICQGAEECLALAEQNYFDLIFLAERLAGASTAQLVARLVDLFPETIVIMVSPEPTVPAAVEALRLGAFDFVPDPEDEDSLVFAVEQGVQYKRLRRENGERRREINQKYDVQNIVGQSRPMQDVFRMIHKVAATDASVLILGESGTGKELVARAIHAQSARAERPLVPVNCGAIPAELLESELFGHEKGAFTGAIKTRLGRVKGLGHKRLQPEVIERMMRYHWPGNVRELENLLERLVILSE